MPPKDNSIIYTDQRFVNRKCLFLYHFQIELILKLEVLLEWQINFTIMGCYLYQNKLIFNLLASNTNTCHST